MIIKIKFKKFIKLTKNRKIYLNKQIKNVSQINRNVKIKNKKIQIKIMR